MGGCGGGGRISPGLGQTEERNKLRDNHEKILYRHSVNASKSCS